MIPNYFDKADLMLNVDESNEPKSDRSGASSPSMTTTTTNAPSQPKSHVVSRDKVGELLNSKVEDFFALEMNKLRHKLSTDKPINDVSEILKQNSYVFREIDQFARRQNRLMDSQLQRVQSPAFKVINNKQNDFEEADHRLTMLLKSKNLECISKTRSKQTEIKQTFF